MSGPTTKPRAPTFPEWVEQGKRFWVAAVTVAGLGAAVAWGGWQYAEVQQALASQQATTSAQQAEIDALREELAAASRQLAILEVLAGLLREELDRGES